MMNFQLRSLFLILLGLSVVYSGAAVVNADSEEYSKIRFPAKGNLFSDEGTIALWVKPYTDTEDSEGRFYTFYPFRVNLQHADLGLLWKPKIGLQITLSLDGKQIRGTPQMRPYIRINKFVWPTDQWNHVAVTWKERTLTILLNGKLVARSSVNRPIRLDGQGHIDIGMAFSKIAVDDIWISSKAVSPQELQEKIEGGAMQVDEHTLLLDPCEAIEQTADGPSTKCTMISGFSEEIGGLLIGDGYETVPGRFGEAIKLFE